MNWIDGSLPAGMNRLLLEGKDVFIDTDTTIFGDVRLGAYTIVQRKAWIVGASTIEIGAFCHLGEGFHCATHEQHMAFLPSTYIWADVFDLPWSRGCGLVGLDERKEEASPASVRIGNDVWMGREVTVTGGITVGDGCVFRDGCLVNRDCAPYGVYEGAPARRVGERCPAARIDELRALRWWDWPLDRIRRNARLLGMSLTAFDGDLADLVVA